MNRVITRNLGIVHFNAYCLDCEWVFDDYKDRNEGYSEIRKHVRKTGHTVQLERGVATQYCREEIEVKK